MPRLTNAQYLYQRKKLRVDWFERQADAFSRLDSPEQLALHDYFAPTEQFSEEEALAHRVEITKALPSLPQRAGRAYQEALPFLEAPWPKPAEPQANRAARRHPVKQGSRQVVIRAVRRPQVDVHKLSRALMTMIDARLAEERKDKVA